MSRSSNWSTIAFAAGLLLAISSASSYAQTRVLYKVIAPVVGSAVSGALAVMTILTTPDRSEAEAAQKANPGSRIEEIRDLAGPSAPSTYAPAPSASAPSGTVVVTTPKPFVPTQK
jgi:hypothetical protein